MDDIEQHAQSDERIDLVPLDCMHFTYLALAVSQFESASDIPEAFEAVREAYDDCVAQVDYTLSRVRLVPMRNALVLAGVPDEPSADARRLFANRLLRGPWADYLRARYAGYEIPPKLFHSTLVRYEAQYLPGTLRDLFQEFEDCQVEQIRIGTPTLSAHNYNWSKFAAL